MRLHALYIEGVNEYNLIRKNWVILETSSYWGLLLEIFQHERGIPSNCTSSTYGDYVPVLCTHRPSLDPIGCNVEFDGRGRASSPAAEVTQDFASRGTRSRNKVALGEPGAGSLL